MKIILTIAWRNIWRQPGRSGVLLAAIVSGLWAGIIVVGWANGLMVQRLDYMIQTELSHGQIHHPEFLTEREPLMYLEDADHLISHLDADERVVSYSSRIIVDGMLQSPVTTSGISIRGINTEKEKLVTNIHKSLTEGNYLSDDIRNPILVGYQLAQKHNLSVGNRVVLSFQDVENELISASFNIVGIYKTTASGYNERNVFVHSDDINLLISVDPVLHEIAIWLQDADDAGAVISDVNKSFPNVLAQSWFELSPELRYLSEAGGMMTSIIITIIMFALAFGILNTMLMAIFERMRELGMLLAIGMSKFRVFMMILLESVMLTLTGAGIGLILAMVSIAFLGNHGIDLSMFGDGLAEWGFDPIIYPIISFSDYVEVIIIVILAAILASVYPAIKAMRQNPLEVEKE